MWDDMQQKVDRLRSLDRRRAVFGAGHHRYQQNPPATNVDIERTEDRLGVALPSELRELYHTLGDGDLGPHLGMTRLDDIEGYTPNEPLQTDQQLYERALSAPPSVDLYVEDVTNFEVSPDMVHGLIVIIQQGCGHRICITTTGDYVGQLVDFSADGKLIRLPFDSSVSSGPLRLMWDDWLDGALERLELVQEMSLGSASAREINDAHKAQFSRFDNGQLFASLADLDYPRGTWNQCHQWYENALANFRIAQ